MVVFPQTVIDVLMRGGNVRLSAKGVFPDIMKQYAAAAKAGGGMIEFVAGDTAIFPQTLAEVTHLGGSHVKWDFASLA